MVDEVASPRAVAKTTLIPDCEDGRDESVLHMKPDSKPISAVKHDLTAGKPHKSCLIIYTGGTFGMAPDEKGVLHPQKGFLAGKLGQMDEFSNSSMPNLDVIEFDNPLDSSDMTTDSWRVVAHVIHNNYYDYDAFVVLHGTDTMAYGASCLSFMLQNLGKSVVLCGAMIPLLFSHSDARRNLVMSVISSTSLEIPEVCLYTDNRLLRGNRTSKTHSTAFDAFTSPKLPPLATMGSQMEVASNLCLPPPLRRFSINTNMHTAMCVYHLVPGFDDQCINAYIDNSGSEGDHALVFLLYGTGNAPIMRKGFLNAVRRALEKGMPVVVASQCPGGPVKLSTYSTGVELQNMGVISAGDMTVEATVMKLAFFMGQGLRGEQLKRRMETNLVGELTDSSTVGDARGEDELCVLASSRRQLGSGRDSFQQFIHFP